MIEINLKSDACDYKSLLTKYVNLWKYVHRTDDLNPCIDDAFEHLRSKISSMDASSCYKLSERYGTVYTWNV